MRRRRAQVLAVVGSLVVLVVTVHFYVVLDEEILWNVMLGMIGVSGILAPLLVYWANPRKPGFSSLRTPLLRLGFEALIIFSFICPLSLTATLFVNCFRDPSETQVMLAAVLRRRVQGSYFFMKTYSVTLTTPIADLPQVFAYVDYDTFRVISKGDWVRLSLKKGRLGARWVFDVAPHVP